MTVPELRRSSLLRCACKPCRIAEPHITGVCPDVNGGYYMTPQACASLSRPGARHPAAGLAIVP
jgi:hypothetical protein